MLATSYLLGGRFGQIERDLLGRHLALHPALAVPVYERQARDGYLRGALGSDGAQPRPDPRGGLRRLSLFLTHPGQRQRRGSYTRRCETFERPYRRRDLLSVGVQQPRL